MAFPGLDGIVLNLTPVQVRGDATQLKRVLRNLLTTSVEALGGATGTVTIATGRMVLTATPQESLAGLPDQMPAGEYAFLRVTDTGCGINPADIDRVCDPFFSTKFPGRGLGMAVALGIVRAHGGAIRVASELGIATTIDVILPLVGRGDQPG